MDDKALPIKLLQRRIDCEELLAYCRQTKDAICPERGWLEACYDELTSRLYPDPARRALPEAQRQAVDAYVSLLTRCLIAEGERLPYDPFFDVLPLTEAEIAASPAADEALRCFKALEDAHFFALLRLTPKATPFDIGAHILGVHHVALTTGRLAAQAGFSVDLPLLSAAALTHDIGKYGCPAGESMPLRHAWYSGLWLQRQGFSRIERIAAHHAVWELEDENLPIETLLLIYADQRVRGTREPNGETVRIYPLEEARGMIRAKILNKTEEKLRRFETCFDKLTAFTQELRSRGVPI